MAAYQQQVCDLLHSYLKSVIDDLKSVDLMAPGAEEYLVKKYLSSSATISDSSSGSSTSVTGKKRKLNASEKSAKKVRVPTSRQILMGKLVKKLKKDYYHVVDKDVKILSQSGERTLSFHQCAVGAAVYASQVFCDSSDQIVRRRRLF